MSVETALQNLARDFRSFVSLPMRSGVVPLEYDALLDRAGRLVAEHCEALRLDGLQELVARYAVPAPVSGKTVEVHCPANLWIQLVGGCERRFLRGELSPRPSGGLLPALGLLPESEPTGPERDAVACEALAKRLADDATATPRNQTRRGRLPADESKNKRTFLLAMLQQHPSLKDDLEQLARIVGVSAKTVRQWLANEEQKYRESAAARPRARRRMSPK